METEWNGYELTAESRRKEEHKVMPLWSVHNGLRKVTAECP